MTQSAHAAQEAETKFEIGDLCEIRTLNRCITNMIVKYVSENILGLIWVHNGMISEIEIPKECVRKLTEEDFKWEALKAKLNQERFDAEFSGGPSLKFMALSLLGIISFIIGLYIFLSLKG